MENTRISHYETRRLLGRGGMGEVYEAVDLDLDRRVALKFIAPELAADPDAFRRFEREARSAAALSHPHIATLFAFEREGGRPFIAMELMSGESLRDRLRQGPLAVGEALSLARDVAAGLAHAHRRGIVHRDIKPENLMFDLEGVLKITDFGLAYATQASRMTMTGTSIGTAAYMAPESVRGSAGAPADVFALGIVLHEMIAGSLPFAGDSPLALMYTIANEDPAPLRAARPESPGAVEALVKRILTKDPEQRPDAATVSREIAALTGAAADPDEEPVAPAIAVPAPPAHARTEEHEVERVSPGGLVVKPVAIEAPGERAGRRRGNWLPAVLLAAALGAAWGGWSMWQRSHRNPEQRRQEAVDLANRARGVLPADLSRRDSLRLAQGYVEQAIRRDPDYPEAYLNLGFIQLTLGNRDSAASAYARVARMARAPAESRARALYGLADVDMANGAWQGAADNLRQALRLAGRSPAALPYYNNLGYALVMAGQPDSAREVLVRGLEQFRGNANLQKNLGLAEFRLGNPKAALAALDAALEADPALATARELRERVQQALARR